MDLNVKDPTYQAFVNGLRSARHQETPYLVFADWLDEQNDGYGHPFAAFIRACCEGRKIWEKDLGISGFIGIKPPSPFAQWSPWAVWTKAVSGLTLYWRSQEFFSTLSPHHQAGWLWEFGFPKRVYCSTWEWLMYGHQVCAMGPVGEVVLDDAPRLRVTVGMTGVELTWAHENPRWAMPKTRSVLLDRDDYDDSQSDLRTTRNIVAMKMLTEIFPEDMVEEFQFNGLISPPATEPGTAAESP